MNVAVLFRAKGEENYYYRSLKTLLGTGILQNSACEMRVALGDVLTRMAGAKTQEELLEICREVYTPIQINFLLREKLEAMFPFATVFSLVFENMPLRTATAFHQALRTDDGYLGTMDVDYSNAFHLRFFRNSLPQAFRFKGKLCSMFYSMGSNEDPDLEARSILESFGFEISYEDVGARRSGLDSYNSVPHFRRIKDFESIFTTDIGIAPEIASEVAHRLEELHPRLFDSLASAARRLRDAETWEDLSQAAVTGRRFLEQLADCLFPAQSMLRNGKKVGPAQYKNRLWAFIEESLATSNSDPTRPELLGKRIDRLFESFNSGVHIRKPKALRSSFGELINLVWELIEINGAAFKRPYLFLEDE